MTYEEIKQKYPVGKVLHTQSWNACHRHVWFTKVEGWVFDGKEWYVAREEEEDGHYVWEIFSKEELEELEELEVKRLRQEYLESHILEF